MAHHQSSRPEMRTETESGAKIQLGIFMHDSILFHIEHSAARELVSQFVQVQGKAEAQVSEIDATYFDTADLALRHAGASLCIEHAGNGRIERFTIATDCHPFSGGIRSVQSLIFDLPDPCPNLLSIMAGIPARKGPAKRLHDALRSHQVQEIFHARITRHTWTLPLGSGMVLCCLEQGRTGCREQSENFSEFSISAPAGALPALLDFARAALEMLPLTVGTLCRHDAGCALFRPAATQAVVARLPRIRKGVSVSQACNRILTSCLNQIQDNQAGVTGQWHAESLHQLRVGLRRLRAAFGLFKPILPLTVQLKTELAWLGRLLGTARDWDVFTGASMPALLQIPHPGNNEKELLDNLMQLACERTGEAHERVRSALSSGRYARLLLQIFCWQTEMTARLKQSPKKFSLRHLLDAALKVQQQRLFRLDLNSAALSTDGLHALRIIIKKMRYMLEFHKAACPSGIEPQYSALTASLQELLGSSNDAQVALRLLNELRGRSEAESGNVAFIADHFSSLIKARQYQIHKLLGQLLKHTDLP